MSFLVELIFVIKSLLYGTLNLGQSAIANYLTFLRRAFLLYILTMVAMVALGIVGYVSNTSLLLSGAVFLTGVVTTVMLFLAIGIGLPSMKIIQTSETLKNYLAFALIPLIIASAFAFYVHSDVLFKPVKSATFGFSPCNFRLVSIHRDGGLMRVTLEVENTLKASYGSIIGPAKLVLNASGSYLSDNLGNRSRLSRTLKITPITIPAEAKEIILVTYEGVPSNASKGTIVLDYGESGSTVVFNDVKL